MARKDVAVDDTAYSSTARKVLVLGSDGASMASASNPLPVDASVTIGTVNLEAEMKVDTGHDLYVTTNNIGDGVDTISFDTVTGLTLEDIQAVENKTEGWIYKTKGATVAADEIELDMSVQETGAPVPGATDEFEIVYRGASRLTDKTQMSMITDGTETWNIDASGFGQVDIAAQSLTAVKVSKDANANADDNPIYTRISTANWFNAVLDSADATSGSVVKAGTADKKIYVTSVVISTSVQGWVQLQDEDANALTGKIYLAANGGTALTFSPSAPLVLDVANKDLEVWAQNAGDLSVTLVGYVE
jgi:hypothetical protein